MLFNENQRPLRQASHVQARCAVSIWDSWRNSHSARPGDLRGTLACLDGSPFVLGPPFHGLLKNLPQSATGCFSCRSPGYPLGHLPGIAARYGLDIPKQPGDPVKHSASLADAHPIHPLTRDIRFLSMVSLQVLTHSLLLRSCLAPSTSQRSDPQPGSLRRTGPILENRERGSLPCRRQSGYHQKEGA